MKAISITLIILSFNLFSINNFYIFAANNELNQYLYLAQQNADDLKYTESLIFCEKALNIDKKCLDCLFLKTNVLFKLKQYDTAIITISQYIKIKNDNPESYLLKGILYYNLNKYNEAIKEYSFAINLDPFVNRYYHYRALAYLKLKENTNALNDLNTAIEMQNFSMLIYNLFENEKLYIQYQLRGEIKLENNFIEEGCRDLFISSLASYFPLELNKLYQSKCTACDKKFLLIKDKYKNQIEKLKIERLQKHMEDIKRHANKKNK